MEYSACAGNAAFCPGIPISSFARQFSPKAEGVGVSCEVSRGHLLQWRSAGVLALEVLACAATSDGQHELVPLPPQTCHVGAMNCSSVSSATSRRAPREYSRRADKRIAGRTMPMRIISAVAPRECALKTYCRFAMEVVKTKFYSASLPLLFLFRRFARSQID